jgi:proteasome lid subunit RPN8/RPN11
LAELQRFADALEADLWQDYLDATLVDLAVDDALQIDFVFSDEQVAVPPPSELLLDHVVLFPEDSPADDAAAERPDPSELEPKAEETEPYTVVPIAQIEPEGLIKPPASEASQNDEAIPDVEKSEELESVSGQPTEEAAPTEQPEDVEEEPNVTVAESEPIHEEREVPKAAEETVVAPRVRILGRRRPLGHGTASAVDILINEGAFRDAQAHAISSPDREVAGVLIGPPPEKQPDGRYVVHISDMIIAKHTRMQGASVTYTPESWRYVNDRLAAMYPEDTAVIVGWYHTHPGFGIFLSGMDRFIHHNFFTQIWHVALVLDPLAGRSGFFSWNRPKSQVEPYDFPWPSWAADSW